MRIFPRTSVLFLSAALAASLGACGGGGGDNPDARPTPDGMVSPDGMVNPDAMATDAMPDAMPDVSAEIQAARDAADGTVDLPIDGAYVTYVRPEIGADPAGFYIQAAQTGPALFVQIDPASQTPPPAVGDTVSFTIAEMGTFGNLRTATAIANWSQDATGFDVSTLDQDLSAATDLTSAIDSYESELVTVTGTVAADFAAAGTGFVQAQVETAGITADTNLRLRLPVTLADSMDVVATCGFTVTTTPFGRFSTTAQLGAWVAGDIALTGCPAPKVVSATASDPTTVVVTFDRNLKDTTVMTDGSQFTIMDSSTSLAVTAAAVSGRTVALTTGAQTGGTSYTVTVANTVTDNLDSGVDGTANTATFTGFLTPAVVRINEVNGHIASGCDLIELRVMAGGTMENYKLRERDTGSLIDFPAGFLVATNDIIVVHMNVGSSTCNPNGAVSETTAKDQQPNASFPQNYDTAWDFWSTDNGLTNSNNVFTLYDGVGTIMDAVFTADPSIATTASGTTNQAATVAAATQWEMVGGGIPTNGFVDADFNMWAAQDMAMTGTDAAGDTIQRNDDDDNNDKDDWTQTTQSWGALNAGQTAQ
jgi:hypothetical protein